MIPNVPTQETPQVAVARCFNHNHLERRLDRWRTLDVALSKLLYIRAPPHLMNCTPDDWWGRLQAPAIL
jgi:hypothetical protein